MWLGFQAQAVIERSHQGFRKRPRCSRNRLLRRRRRPSLRRGRRRRSLWRLSLTTSLLWCWSSHCAFLHICRREELRTSPDIVKIGTSIIFTATYRIGDISILSAFPTCHGLNLSSSLFRSMQNNQATPVRLPPLSTDFDQGSDRDMWYICPGYLQTSSLTSTSSPSLRNKRCKTVGASPPAAISNSGLDYDDRLFPFHGYMSISSPTLHDWFSQS